MGFPSVVSGLLVALEIKCDQWANRAIANGSQSEAALTAACTHPRRGRPVLRDRRGDPRFLPVSGPPQPDGRCAKRPSVPQASKLWSA
jgi:hypothetical protein